MGIPTTGSQGDMLVALLGEACNPEERCAPWGADDIGVGSKDANGVRRYSARCSLPLVSMKLTANSYGGGGERKS